MPAMSSASRMAMMAITTSSSIRVKPDRFLDAMVDMTVPFKGRLAVFGAAQRAATASLPAIQVKAPGLSLLYKTIFFDKNDAKRAGLFKIPE